MKEVIKKDKWFFDKTFEPIRYLLTIDDKKFDRLFDPQNEDESNALEWGNKVLLTSNMCFSEGLTGFLGAELGKTLAEFDLIQLNFSFLDEMVVDDKLRSLVEDIRMSFQNFTYALLIRSYYSAFSEYRKILESVIWIQTICSRNEIPERIDDLKYSHQLESISPILAQAYRYFSRNIHFDKDPIYYNLNKFYEQEDHLFKSISYVQQTSKLVIDLVYCIFDKFESKSVQRYKVMVDLLRKSWHDGEYKLEDLPTTPTRALEFHEGYQPKFEELIRSGTFTLEDKEYFYKRFTNGIINIIYSFPECIVSDIKKQAHEYKRNIETFVKYPRLHKDLLWFMITLSGKSIMDVKKMQEHTEYAANYHGPVLANLAVLHVELTELEIKRHGDKKIAILKTVLEDFIFNLAINKGENYMILNLVWEITNYKDKEFYEKTVKFRHIQPTNRIKYQSMEKNTTTGNQNYANESIEALFKAIEGFIDGVKT